jgi:hypothetical protein
MSRLAAILPNKMVAGAQLQPAHSPARSMVALPAGRIYEFAIRRHPRETEAMPSASKPLLTPPARAVFTHTGG